MGEALSTRYCSREVGDRDTTNMAGSEVSDEEFEFIGEYVKDENYNFVTESEFEEVLDDQYLMLDAFTLLGGNENLLHQLIPRLEEYDYSSNEEAFIRLATTHTRGEELSTGSPFNLGHLLELMSPLHRERLPRILAKALLFCSRYKDTKLYSSHSFPNSHILLVSLSNCPGSNLPLGQTDAGFSCSRLAILFHWGRTGNSPLDTEKEAPDKVDTSKDTKGPLENVKARNRVRTYSGSLELEIKMLSITDVFAIIPCP